MQDLSAANEGRNADTITQENSAHQAGPSHEGLVQPEHGLHGHTGFVHGADGEGKQICIRDAKCQQGQVCILIGIGEQGGMNHVGVLDDTGTKSCVLGGVGQLHASNGVVHLHHCQPKDDDGHDHHH